MKEERFPRLGWKDDMREVVVPDGSIVLMDLAKWINTQRQNKVKGKLIDRKESELDSVRGKMKFLRVGFENSTIPLQVTTKVLCCRNKESSILKCTTAQRWISFQHRTFPGYRGDQEASRVLPDLNNMNLTPRQMFSRYISVLAS